MGAAGVLPTETPGCSTGGRDELVGRVEELGALDRALERARREGPGVVLVEGPSGMGKSALVRAFAAGLVRRDATATVLTARCHPAEALPFRALDGAMDALAGWLRRLPPERRASFDVEATRAASGLFPVLETVLGRATDLPAEVAERRRDAAAGLRELLRRVADAVPLVLALDDVQWGDADSASLLGELLAPPDAPPILVVLSMRPEGREREFIRRLADLEHDVLRGVRQDEIQLGPLPVEDLRVLAARCGHAAEAALRIAAAARGIPFLVNAIARSSGDPGLLASAETALDGPLADLTPSALEILECACVAGHALSVAALHRAAGVPLDDRAQVTLLSARLLKVGEYQGSTRLEPYHDRVRDHVLARIAPARRMVLHLALAEALSGETSVEEHVGLHLLAGGEHRRALVALRAAAERAANQLAHRHAAKLLERAVFLADEQGVPREQVDALRVLRGEMLHHAGQNLASANALAEVAPRLPMQAAVDARRWAARSLFMIGEKHRAVELLAAAEPRLRRALGRTGLRLGWSLFWARRRAWVLARRVEAGEDFSGRRDSPYLDTVIDGMLAASFSDGQLLIALAVELLLGVEAEGGPTQIAVAWATEAVAQGYSGSTAGPARMRTCLALARRVLDAARIQDRPAVELMERLAWISLGQPKECLARQGARVGEGDLTTGESLTLRRFSQQNEMVCQIHLGHWVEMERSVRRAERDAIYQDNPLGMAVAAFCNALFEAMRGEVDGTWARLENGRAVAARVGSTTTVSWNWYACLWAGIVADAPDEVERAAAALRHGRRMDIGMGAVEGDLLAARHALYFAGIDPRGERVHARRAERAALRLWGRRTHVTARGLGAALLAGVAWHRRDPGAVADWSGRALPFLRAAGQEGMEMALLRLRLEAGLDRGSDVEASWQAWCEAHIIGRPERSLAMYLPPLGRL